MSGFARREPALARRSRVDYRGASTQIRIVANHAGCAVTFIPSALRTLKNVESFGSPSGVSAL